MLRCQSETEKLIFHLIFFFNAALGHQPKFYCHEWAKYGKGGWIRR
jgi:hypothetical protein